MGKLFVSFYIVSRRFKRAHVNEPAIIQPFFDERNLIKIVKKSFKSFVELHFFCVFLRRIKVYFRVALTNELIIVLCLRSSKSCATSTLVSIWLHSSPLFTFKRVIKIRWELPQSQTSLYKKQIIFFCGN